VTPFYDPMLMKVIARGEDRDAALDRLDRALMELKVDGVTTNIALLRAVIGHAEFRAGRISTAFLTKHHDELVHAPAR
jgi:acetyl-CoA carboxylase biotin carboxylase subunit